MLRLLLALMTVSLPLSVAAQPVTVEGVRVWEAPDNTRVVFDISGPADHALFSLADPERIVIDIKHARVQTALPDVSGASGMLRAVRSGVRDRDDLRIVLDLSAPATPRSFVLRPNDTYGYRLVVDLAPKNGVEARSAATPQPGRLRELVIAIDAGHGGEDPGATGPSGLREKDVVLQIAKRLARLVEAEYGMTPVLIRDGDYYVSHRERINRARRARADLFISIHADSFHDARAHGASVYVLSERGASDEAAKLLAERENASDMIGGVKLDDKDDMVRSVLLDLSLTGSMGAGRTFAGEVLKELERVNRIHKHEIQAARFAMLKSPDVPSILVETAFISNPAEEARLRDPHHQAAIAHALLYGMRNYFNDHAPPGTLVAAHGVGGDRAAYRRHVIARGETLSGIAQRYNTSVQALRVSNNIASDRIRIGDTLLIPGG